MRKPRQVSAWLRRPAFPSARFPGRARGWARGWGGVVRHGSTLPPQPEPALESLAGLVILGTIVADVVQHPEGARAVSGAAGVLHGSVLSSLLGGAYGPPAPRPWHEGVNWRQVLGGEPLELYGGEW